jgi:hypothetical protein
MEVKKVEQGIARIKANSINELFDKINEEFGVALVLFDENGVVKAFSKDGDKCKCYYLLSGEEKTCSFFDDSEFIADILREIEIDRFCDYFCRVVTKSVKINEIIVTETATREKKYTLAIYQYNLKDDDLTFHLSENPSLAPFLEKDSNIVNYLFWKANIFTLEEREKLINFTISQLKTFL